MQQRRKIKLHFFFFLMDGPSTVYFLMPTPFMLLLNNSIHVINYTLTGNESSGIFWCKSRHKQFTINNTNER